MSQVVIRVDGLGKRYRIGHRETHKTLRETLGDLPRSFFPPRKMKSDEYIWVLKDISFEMKEGEMVGVIGSNGAGKSTLLKILSRITEPTAGYAEIHGRVASLLEVGSGFHPELTGRDNIYLSGTILGMKRSEINQKLHEIVAFSGVEKFIDTPVKRYSIGMHLRLAFAVAAHLEPEILFVDEVLAVGDVSFQQKCLGKMGEVSKRGRTVIFVSHNMPAITSLCQRVILLENGRIGMDDLGDRTVARYLSLTRERQVPVNGFISLVDHPGRLKKGEELIRLTHCQLSNSNRQPVTFFISGEEARVAIGYQITRPAEAKSVVFYLTFNDILQRRIFTCSNELMGRPFKALDEAGEVQCHIPKLPLSPGSYTFNIGCKVNPVWSDWVYEAVTLDVVAGDFFGTGALPPEGWGNTLVEHHWSIASK